VSSSEQAIAPRVFMVGSLVDAGDPHRIPGQADQISKSATIVRAARSMK
jgi:hypothetical protein